jgi:hypothetical protein
MSRGQEGAVVDTSKAQNAAFNQNAQQSYTQAQGDITNYGDQLSKFAAANPYGEGGAYQADQNKVLSNTADASGLAAGQALQSQAVRTGQNAGGAIAATEAIQEQNERSLAGQEAEANAGRIGAGSSYGGQVLSGSEVPAQLEAGLVGTESGAGNAALGIDEKASEGPSFTDILGGSFAKGFGSGAANLAICWIARELWGSWTDSRVILVRMWLHTEFVKRWYGRPVLWAYARYGQRVALAMQTRPRLRRFFQRIFDGALKQAEAWHDGEQEKMRQEEKDEKWLGVIRG